MHAADGKCQPPMTTLLWIGIFFDTISVTMKIDLEKVREAIHLCRDFLADVTITHKQLQKLLGKIFYSIRCTGAARRFTSRLHDLLRLAHSLNTVYITPEARLDASWLMRFLPVFNGVTFMKPDTAERVCFVDACLTGGGVCPVATAIIRFSSHKQSHRSSTRSLVWRPSTCLWPLGCGRQSGQA